VEAYIILLLYIIVEGLYYYYRYLFSILYYYYYYYYLTAAQQPARIVCAVPVPIHIATTNDGSDRRRTCDSRFSKGLLYSARDRPDCNAVHNNT